MPPHPFPRITPGSGETAEPVDRPPDVVQAPEVESSVPHRAGAETGAAAVPQGLSEHAQYTVALLLGGALLVYVSWERSGLVVFVGIAMVLIGIVLLQRLSNRFRGRRVEQKAIRKLRLPENWTVESNVPIPGMGDSDLLVISPKGERFSVEIKAFRGVALKQATMFSKEERLTYPSGQKILPDPLHQAIQNAEFLNANPIIWLPEAKGKQIQKFKKSGVIVVQGQRAIRRVLGASWF